MKLSGIILLIFASYSAFSQTISSRAQNLLEKGDTTAAILEIEGAIEKYGLDGNLLYNLAMIQWWAGKKDEAILNWKMAISQNPKLMKAHYFLGNHFFEIKEFKEAEKHYSMFLSEDKDNKEIIYKRAQTNMKLGDHYAAISDWSKLIEADSALGQIFNRGLSRLALNDLEGSRDDFERVLKRDPDYAEAHYFMGLSFYNSYEKRKAEKSWKNAIKSDPEFRNAYYQLAFLYNELNKKGKSCKYLSAAQKLGWIPKDAKDEELLSICN